MRKPPPSGGGSSHVPAEKITAAAMDIMEDYVPIVEGAVEELRLEIRQDAFYQAIIKEKLKDNLRQLIVQETERRIKEAVNTVYYEKFGKIEQSVREILSENI